MLENMKYLKPVFEAKKNKKSIEQNCKSLRKQFKEDIWDKIVSDIFKFMFFFYCEKYFAFIFSVKI